MIITLLHWTLVSLCFHLSPTSFVSLLRSSTPPPVWHDRTSNSQNSPFPPQPSPPLSLSTPNAHSSPRGVLKGLGGGPGVRRETDSTDLSLLLLGNGGLEHSLLEAMEGLGGLSLGGDGGLPPLLPEKRRGGEGGDLGSCSPSLSGFSSPHSGSSLSIPFSSCMTPDPLRGLSGAPSPGAGIQSQIVQKWGVSLCLCGTYWFTLFQLPLIYGQRTQITKTLSSEQFPRLFIMTSEIIVWQKNNNTDLKSRWSCHGFILLVQ